MRSARIVLKGPIVRATKNQLRRVIREEKARILSEQSHAASEGALLADLTMTSDAIGEIAAGMYGLVDPIGDAPAAGDEMAGDLELQVERLNVLFDQLEEYFESLVSTPGAVSTGDRSHESY